MSEPVMLYVISFYRLAKLHNLSLVWFGLSMSLTSKRHISEQCKSVSEMFATTLSESMNRSMTSSLITSGLIVHVEDKR